MRGEERFGWPHRRGAKRRPAIHKQAEARTAVVAAEPEQQITRVVVVGSSVT